MSGCKARVACLTLKHHGSVFRYRPLVQRSSFGPAVLLHARLPLICSRLSAGHGPFGSVRTLTSQASTQDALESHDRLVRDISSTIKGYHGRKEKFRIFHGSTNSTRPPASKGQNLVDLSGLNRVLEVNQDKRTALVEPNVPMDRLIEATMEHGLIPEVVMDFPGITVGGGYAGTSGESSSFRHGFFDRTLNYVEMVLGNGDVVRCSQTERPDLFNGAAGAVGTLGTTTCAEIRLRQAKAYVETTYHPVSSMAEAIEKIRNFLDDSNVDYLDGILYSLTSGVIITGCMTNSPSSKLPIRRFSSANDPWFYLHAQTHLKASTTTPVTEAIPLADYLFRYDRGGFWVGRLAFNYCHFPFNSLTRWWLDDFLHTRMLYTALHTSGQSRRIVVQDLALPYETANEFVNYTDEAFGIYPLWLCPLRTGQSHTFHPSLGKGTSGNQMLNIGLWGEPKPKSGSSATDFVALTRDLESRLAELGGRKWLYAQTYYDESTFWDFYGGQEWYQELRSKYHATHLPSVYDKVRTDIEAETAAARKEWWKGYWPLGGVAGLRAAIKSKTYLQARDAKWKDASRK